MSHIKYSTMPIRRKMRYIMHLSFIKISENVHNIDEAVCPKTQNYIVTIIENKAIDIYRFKKWKETVEYIDGIIGTTVENQSLQGLAHCMAKLSTRYRQIILLKYYNRCNNKEISKLLDLTEANVIKLNQRTPKITSSR